MHHRFIALGVAVLAGVACSSPQEPPSAAAKPPAASATAAPALATSASNPSGLTYLYDLMQRPDFSTAFAALSNADQLPPWTSQGGVATPAQQVTVDGRGQLLATACKPHDCPSERILILYDEGSHAMSGVFARRKPNAPDNGDSNDPANDELIWLGAPDDAARQLLQHALYSRD